MDEEANSRLLIDEVRTWMSYGKFRVVSLPAPAAAYRYDNTGNGNKNRKLKFSFHQLIVDNNNNNSAFAVKTSTIYRRGRLVY